MVERPFRRFGSGREALWEVRECSVGPHGSPAVVGSPSQRSVSGREAVPKVREWSEALPEIREWSEGPLEGP